MCGICGLVSLDGGPGPDRGALAAMNRTMAHRGPDSEGMVIDGPAGLAMRRLSIIDLEGGDQPIASEDGGAQVIQNGEIYNYRELRVELERRGTRCGLTWWPTSRSECCSPAASTPRRSPPWRRGRAPGG